MNKKDCIRAFSLRCEGLNWEEIGELMHYSGRHVAREVSRISQGRNCRRREEHAFGPEARTNHDLSLL